MCPCWPSEKSCIAVGFFLNFILSTKCLTTFPLAIKTSLQMFYENVILIFTILMFLIVFKFKPHASQELLYAN